MKASSAGRPRGPARGAPPSEVRIIGGQWKRSKLAVLDRPGLRPTPDRVRVTLFNWLGPDLSGWRCLDAFAGSGALGFEAASRGAGEVLLLERDGELVRGLRAAGTRLKAENLRVEQTEALSAMARMGTSRYELVFIDPPFGAGLFEPALRAAAPLLVADGFVYLEADHAWDAAAAAALGLRLHRHGRAGQVHFHLFQRGAER